MRVSLVLPGGGISIGDMVTLAREAEQAGMTGIYVTEAWRSAFVPLAAIAAASERIALGPYVLNAYGRTPWIAGMSALDLDDLSGGRLILGVGSGNVFTNRVFQGVETVRPLRKMAEYVEVLRRIVRACPGEPVEYHGEIHSINDWVTQAVPVRPSIPVYLAAIFPKMRRVAGRVADGVALGALLSTEHIGDVALPAFLEGAGEAGRDPDSLGVLMANFASVDEDRDVAYRAARTAIVNLFAPKPHRHYEQTLTEQGYGGVLERVLGCLARDDRDGAIDAVPDEVVERLTITGTSDDCVARIAAYQSHVDEVLIVNVGSTRHRRDAAAPDDRDTLVSTFRSVIELGSRAVRAAPGSATT